MAALRMLARETRQWRIDYRQDGDRLMAAACAIRENAFLDLLMKVKGKAARRKLEDELRAMDPLRRL